MKKIICFCLIFTGLILIFTKHQIMAEEKAYSKVTIEGNVFLQGHQFTEEDFNLYDKDEIIIMTVELKDDFSCMHNFNVEKCEEDNCKIDNENEMLNHRKEMKEFFRKKNYEIAEKLSINLYFDASISYYAPFSDYYYENYDDILKEREFFINIENEERIKRIHFHRVNKLIRTAERNQSSSENYDFTQALEDVGVNNNKTATGKGVKVGILETYANKIDNTSNLPVGTNFIVRNKIPNNEFSMLHAFQVASVLGGTSGVARDVKFYLADWLISTDSFYSPYASVNWLIDNGVHIINISQGFWHMAAGESNNSLFAGYYTWASLFFDYVGMNSRICVVASAGNIKEEGFNLVMSPSTGANVISVASTDSNGKISKFSSYGLINTFGIMSPNIAAPGGGLVNVQNIDSQLNGTSFSAPIVSGIIALLMEEFSYLKYQPEMVMSLLYATTNEINAQYEKNDVDCGTGLINYEKARKAASDWAFHKYYIPREYFQASRLINLEANGRVDIVNFNIVSVALPIISNDFGGTISGITSPGYTKYILELIDVETNNVLATGKRIGSFYYISYLNNSIAKICKVRLRLSGNKIDNSVDTGTFWIVGDVAFISHEHNQDYQYFNPEMHEWYCECSAFYYLEHHYFIYDSYYRIKYCPICNYGTSY